MFYIGLGRTPSGTGVLVGGDDITEVRGIFFAMKYAARDEGIPFRTIANGPSAIGTYEYIFDIGLTQEQVRAAISSALGLDDWHVILPDGFNNN